MRFRVNFILLACGLFLTACGLLGNSDEESADSFTPTPDPAVASTEIPVPAASTAEPILETDNVLTVWTIPQFAPDPDTNGGAILQAQLDAFARLNPDIELIVEQKAIEGEASMLAYLRAGRKVAPNVLPDLIMLPSRQLQTAVSEALIYPLDDFIDEGKINALYPSAKALSQNNSSTVGYPFAFANMQHVAYKTDAFPEAFPTSWNELFRDSEESFVFPANGRGGAELILQLYLDDNGRLTDNNGNPVLDQTPLTTTLGLFEFGLGEGNIAFASDRAETAEDAWDVFSSGSPSIVLTTAHQFMQERTRNPELGFARTLGNREPLTPIAESWLWAISTDDIRKQEIATDLLIWLTNSENLGEWSFAAQVIPANESALRQWPTEDPYTIFISELAANAQPYPVAASRPLITALNEAVLSVIAQTSSAPAAAQEATASIR